MCASIPPSEPEGCIEPTTSIGAEFEEKFHERTKQMARTLLKHSMRKGHPHPKDEKTFGG